MPARLAQQENENGLMEAPFPHGALRSKERDEDIPPPLIFNDIQRFSGESPGNKVPRDSLGVVFPLLPVIVKEIQ
jgi:hypothetical protein